MISTTLSVALALFVLNPHSVVDLKSRTGNQGQQQAQRTDGAKAAANKPAQQSSNGFTKATQDATVNGRNAEQGADERSDHGFYRVEIVKLPGDHIAPVSVLINGILAIAALVTLILVFRQARANEMAAKAAKDTADVMIGAERAWLLVTPTNWSPAFETYGGVEKDKQLQQVSLSIKNVGRSPARIVKVACKMLALNSADDIPSLPQYPEPVQMNELLLVPGDSIAQLVELDGASSPGLFIEVLNRKKVLFTFGFVQYRDIFGQDREVRIGYLTEGFWPPGQLRQSVHIRRAGPGPYNSAT